jgi:hypothetical protein
MGVAKQVDTVKMGAFYFNGAYRAFHTAPNNSNTNLISFPVWEAQYEENLEFLNDAVTRGLTGKERGNPSGYRATVDIFLDNSYPSDSSNIRALLEKFANQFDRTVLQTNTVSKTNTTIKLEHGVGGVENSNYYNNLVVFDDDTPANQALVESYSSATKEVVVKLLSGANVSSWSSNVSLIARPNIPTVLGVSTDNDSNNVIFCNLIDGKFGFRRELTVNLQTIRISGREIDRTRLISDKYRVGT